MLSRYFLIVTLLFWSAGNALLPQSARAETPLTQAIVQTIRNQVKLMLKGKSPRPARQSDRMTPGDALATNRAARADLRFNDGSLARVGERALFRFVPGTRKFRLEDGTVLLLIRPGQGKTRLETPNAAAGIRGSALFVRYNPETEMTIIGALTNSQIEVANANETQRQPLQAGQMAVVVKNQIVRVYNFDLNKFYETSDMVQDLGLAKQAVAADSDPAIAAVRQETTEALKAQAPIIGQGILETPDFVRIAGAPAAQTAAPASPALGQLPTQVNPTLVAIPGEIRRAATQPSEPTARPPEPPAPGTPERPTVPGGNIAQPPNPTIPAPTLPANPPVIPTTPTPAPQPPAPIGVTPTTPPPAPPPTPVVSQPVSPTPTSPPTVQPPVPSLPSTPTIVTPTLTPPPPTAPVTPPVTAVTPPTPASPPVAPTPITPPPVAPTPVTPTAVAPTPVTPTLAPPPATPTIITPSPAPAPVPAAVTPVAAPIPTVPTVAPVPVTPPTPTVVQPAPIATPVVPPPVTPPSVTPAVVTPAPSPAPAPTPVAPSVEPQTPPATTPPATTAPATTTPETPSPTPQTQAPRSQ